MSFIKFYLFVAIVLFIGSLVIYFCYYVDLVTLINYFLHSFNNIFKCFRLKRLMSLQFVFYEVH